MDIVEVCEEIKEDMHKIEEDSKKIDCYAILDLILHSFKCFIDSIKCCFKIKISYIMKRFINIKSYELIDIQNTIQDIYHLKKNNYISDLRDKEIEELQYYKNYLKIFIMIFKN